MGRTLWRAAIVVIAGAGIGLAVNVVSPRKIAFLRPPKTQPAVTSEYLPFNDARQYWQSGATFFLDARDAKHYAAGHIAGAQNLSIQDFDAQYPVVAPLLAPESIIVVYCDGMQCDLSHDLAARLRQLGYKNVHILQNGWSMWRAAGLPTATGNQP